MEQIAVSVIVPIYNVEPYLRECLDSLTRQTLKNIEVIMVNDGSTDSSELVAREYAGHYGNFTLISQENKGLSAARNAGIPLASGKYIYFIDSDDHLLDNSLEVLFLRAERDDLDVLHFVAYTFTDDDPKLTWERDGGYKYRGTYPDVYKGTDLLQRFWDNQDTGLPSCCMFIAKADLIKGNNLTFLEGIIHEDHLFHLQLLALSSRAAVLNEPLYCRRIRNGSITQTTDYGAKISSMYKSAEAADKFFTDNPELHAEVCDRFIGFFFHMMMQYWESCDKSLRNKQEIKKYYQLSKPLVKKYHYNNEKKLRLFTLSKTLFSLYNALKSN
jgi:glycosyltransferase involved in cell wall biosynthesis